MASVKVTLKDGSKFAVTDVTIEESIVGLTLYYQDTSYTVIPLGSINYYDVEPDNE